MLGLRKLVRAETQLVYLTAILRPADEREFGTLVKLPARGVHWFRGSITRRNVRYRIQRYSTPKKKKKNVLAALMEKKKQQYTGQIIVYYNTMKKAE
jgi:superfamily II DNA helicase RecQ